MNLSKIANLLSLLSGAALNPIFSGSGAAISSILKLASTLVAAGDAGAKELEKLTADVEAMVKDGRQPTSAEWRTLRQRSDAAHAALQASAASPAVEEKPGPNEDLGDDLGEVGLEPTQLPQSEQ